MKGNWAEEYDRRQDERRENELKFELNELLKKLDRINESTREFVTNIQKKKLLEQIMEIEKTLRREGCDCEIDYSIEAELQEIDYKIKQKDYENTKEFKSWKEYEEEEKKYEEER